MTHAPAPSPATPPWRGALHRWRRWTLAFGVLLAACGGGVDSGGTGATTSYASGPITGFGSVIVNGVRFDDSSAAVRDDDGTLRGRDALRLGMSTEVRGGAVTTDAAGARVSVASTITFSSEIVGPVDSIDPALKQLVALGQPVDINAATVFDADSLPGGLAALRTGDIVEIYALIDAASGRYAATRIERKTAVNAYRLRGVVRQLDTASKSFSIGGERLSYAATSTSPPAGFDNDTYVRVRLQTSRATGGAWPILDFKDGTPRPQDSDDVHLEGVVSAFTSAARFSVDGVPVDASALPATAGLSLGVRVEVEGPASGGTIVAREVKVKTPDAVDNQNFELRGQITAVDAASLSVVVRGVTVVYSLTATEFRDGTVADLQLGRDVEARGTLSADGTRMVATRIRIR